MELTLNLVWVCVAIVGILAQMTVLTRGSAASGRRISCWRKIVAMGCALVILFFVISMTDDLHGQEILIEEKRISKVAAGTKTAAPSSADRLISIDFLLFFPPQAFSHSLPAVRKLVASSELLLETSPEGERLSGRSPPVVLA
ncbi:MAG TPA: hypothetical protein VGR55_09975 [Candidatus Acidoferrum sp.]|nr:hypothetical protein [Candidatus Acidoferrum sp.]